MLEAFVARDFMVLVPFGSGHPYDLVVDLGAPGLVRVQCKTGWPLGGCLVFNARSTDHGRGPRSYRGLADVFGVFYPPLSRVYLLPIDLIAGTKVSLRLEPTRNNQRRGIRFAADFEIDRWTRAALEKLVPQKSRESPVVHSPG